MIHTGKKITAAEIGILSICGIKSVLVFQKPYVAVMSTGDEVRILFIQMHTLKGKCIFLFAPEKLVYTMVSLRLTLIRSKTDN